MTWQKRLGLGLLCTYTCLLFLAGAPVQVLPAGLGAVRLTAYKTLSYFSIVPGLELFYRPFSENFKIHGQCLQVKGYPVNGPPVSLYRAETGCDLSSSWAWNEDIYETMFYRFLGEASWLRVSDFRAKGEAGFGAQAPRKPREDAVYQAMGDYFCHSEWVARPAELAAIAFAWRQDKIDYASGEVAKPYQLLMKWNCLTHKLESAEWRPFLEPRHLEAFLNDQDF